MSFETTSTVDYDEVDFAELRARADVNDSEPEYAQLAASQQPEDTAVYEPTATPMYGSTHGGLLYDLVDDAQTAEGANVPQPLRVGGGAVPRNVDASGAESVYETNLTATAARRMDDGAFAAASAGADVQLMLCVFAVKT